MIAAANVADMDYFINYMKMEHLMNQETLLLVFFFSVIMTTLSFVLCSLENGKRQ